MSEDFNKRFQDLTDFIDKSIQEVRGGKVVEMNHLDGIIARLCADIEKADPEIAKQTQPQLAQMITKLDELAQSLVDYQTQKRGG